MSAPENGAGNLPEMVLFKGSVSEKSHDTWWRIWWMFIQKCLEQSGEHKTAACHTNAGSHFNHIKYRLQCTPLVLFPRSMCLTGLRSAPEVNETHCASVHRLDVA